MAKKNIIANFVLNNYFYIVVLNTLVGFLIGKQYIISVFFPIILYYYAYKKAIKNNNIFDNLVFLILFWMIVTWICNDYTNKYYLIFRCIMGEISFIAAYFIGSRYDLSVLFEKAKIPLIICSFLGIIWFFKPPGAWYTAAYDNTISSGRGIGALDYLRLRSIFSSPYVIVYMCSLCCIYILNKNKLRQKDIALLALYVIVLLLGMMRAPILCILLIMSIVIINQIINKKIQFRKFFYWLLFIIISILIMQFILKNMDVTRFVFFNEKILSITENSGELIEDRIDHQGGFQLQYHIIGDGAGRHAIYVDDYGQISIRDSEYLRILVEQGYIGLFLYGTLITVCLIKCIRNFKYLSFELCIVLFYAICMIGANPLSTADKHCFIFWMTVGRIAAFKNGEYKQNRNLITR